MERFIRLLMLIIAMMFGIIPITKAQDIPFEFHAPFPPTETYDGGGNGTYYDEGKYHIGLSRYCIDFNQGGGSDDENNPVMATADGVVVADRDSGYNGYHTAFPDDVAILHEDGWYSLYMHLNSNSVSVGEEVRAGQVVGYIGGQTGFSPHLHFCIYNSDGQSFMPTPMDGTRYEAGDAGNDVTSANSTMFDDRDSIALTTTNPYSNASNWLGNTAGDIHWWNGATYGTDDWDTYGPVDSLDGDGYARSVYIQDYNGAYCDSTKPYGSGVNDGAIVYDALGGARSAYIVQCEQWQAWISEDAPYTGPESFLGNPVTNVYKAGYYNYYQLFQGGYIRVNADGTVTTKTYANGFAPGEMADGSWNPQISYRFAEAYELRGAHKKLGMPLSGVEQLSSHYYVQHFRGQKPRSDDDRYLLYGVEQQEIVKISVSQYNALIASQSVFVFTNVDDSSTDTLDQSTWDYTSQVLTNLASVDYADLSSSVTCAVDEADSLYVVLNGQDGRIYELETTSDGDSWTSSHLTSLAAVPLSAPGTTAHVFIDEHTGDRYVTFMGNNARINLFHYNGTSWSAVELTSVVAAPLGDITSSPYGYIANGVIYVVFQGNDQRIWRFSVTNGTTYGSLDLTGQASVQYAMSGTSPQAVYNDLTGEHHIVFQGINQRIQRLTYNGSSWSSVEITSVINSDLLDPDSQPFTYVDPSTSYVYTVINGENERIDLIGDYHDNSWGSAELTSLVSVPLTQPGTSPTGYIDPFTGNHVITFQGDNERINQFEGPSWTSIDLTSQAAVEYAAIGTSPVTCVDPFTGVRHMVFVGENGRIQYIRYGWGLP